MTKILSFHISKIVSSIYPRDWVQMSFHMSKNNKKWYKLKNCESEVHRSMAAYQLLCESTLKCQMFYIFNVLADAFNGSTIRQIQHWFQMFGKFRQLGRSAAARSARLLMKIKLIILEIFHRNWYSFFKNKSGDCTGYFSCSERSLPCSVDISTIYDLHIFKCFWALWY